jgi:threonyl-tRNA synthetase
MGTISITLKSGAGAQVAAGLPVAEALRSAGIAVGPEAVAALVNGVETDLSRPLNENASVELLTFESAQGREVYRHTSTHIMAQAVKEVFPTAQLTIGPALEDGF